MLELRSTIEETGAQAQVADQATLAVRANLGGLAAATEEMSASIREIAIDAQVAAGTGREGTKLVTEVATTVARLDESSRAISKVLDLITSIADQTKLLALNATIEAARSGEAGKGFAVVAGEVKDLASQTAGAVRDVSARIDAISDATSGVVSGIGQIATSVERINEAQTTIASAVEEQSVVTNEISKHANDAAAATALIAENLGAVRLAARGNGDGMKAFGRAMHDLSVSLTRNGP